MKLLACFRPTYRVDIYIEYEQPRTFSLFVNACFLPSEIIALLLFLSLPFRFPPALFAGEGLKRQILRRHANNSLPSSLEGLISELRHATRHFGIWFFLELGQHCFHDFHVITSRLPYLVYQKWQETDGMEIPRGGIPAVTVARNLHFAYPRPLAEIEVSQSSPANPGTTLTEACDQYLPPPPPSPPSIDAAISEITLRINHRQSNRKLSNVPNFH